MSITKEVAEAVTAECTVDDLVPELPHLTRPQISKALQNAQFLGLIQRGAPKRCLGKGKGFAPGTWKPLDKRVPRAASVWDYALAAANEHHRRAA